VSGVHERTLITTAPLRKQGTTAERTAPARDAVARFVWAGYNGGRVSAKSGCTTGRGRGIGIGLGGVKVADPGQRPDMLRTAGFLGEIVREIQLILRLMADRQVRGWLKLIPVFTVLYVVSPIDLVPDPILGLGQLDDVAIFMIGLKLFVDLCPRNVVQRLRDELTSHTADDRDESVVEGTYRVLDE